MSYDEFIPSQLPSRNVKLSFTAGDSLPLPMGIFFVDRTHFRVGGKSIDLNCRNIIGKYLNDQSFNERGRFNSMNLKLLLESVLEGVGINNHEVALTDKVVGINFPPRMSILNGIEEALKLEPGWVIWERIEVDGSTTVVVGPRPYGELYQFQRDRDIFSRVQIKDDNETYGRICCHDREFAVAVYRPVPSVLGWSSPAQKTIYIQVPAGMTQQAAATLASQLADALADSGEIEEFVGPFRPQLLPGDRAEIQNLGGPSLLGTITAVKHTFTREGYYTEFTVDSGGVVGKPRFKDMLSQISAQTEAGAIEIL